MKSVRRGSSSKTSRPGPSAGFLAWCTSLGIEVIDPGPYLSGPSTSERRTGDNGCSLWPTAVATRQSPTDNVPWGGQTLAAAVAWPTPASRDWKSSASNKHWNNARPLNEVVALEESLWPTPVVQHRAGSASYSTESGRHSGTTLTDAVKFYPTPSAASQGTNQGGAAGRVGPVRESLETMARTWPTPQSRDERGPTGANGRDVRSSLSDAAMPGRLNPAWVAVLMGFPATWLLLLPNIDGPLAEVSPKKCGSLAARSRRT